MELFSYKRALKQFNNFRKVYCLLLFLFIFCLKGISQTGCLDSLLNYCHNNFHFNGVVLIANANNFIYQHSFGNADEANSIHNSADTKFRLGSLSKQFTAHIIIKLAEAKQISLDDHLSKFIQAFNQPDKKAITIRNLLNHTSGLADYTSLKDFDDQKIYTKDSIANMIADTPLAFDPSSSYAYSNSNFFLLGMVAEKITGKKFKALLNEFVFKNAGMRSSGEDDDDLMNEAKGYVYKNNAVVEAPFIEMKNTEGGGGIYSTANDLLKWSLYFQNQLAADKFLKQALQSSMLPNGNQNIYFGGWCFCPDFIFHEGHINGFANLLAIDTVHHQTIIILSNHDYKQLFITMQSLYDVMNNKSNAIEWIHNANDNNLSQYNGDYSIGDLTVQIKDSSNFLQGKAFGQTELLKHFHSDTFFFINQEGVIQFERDSTNKVMALNSFQDYSWVRLLKK